MRPKNLVLTFTPSSSTSRNVVLRAAYYGILFLLLGFQYRDSVEALPSFLNPVRGTTLPEEIQCYGIPYGAIGFVSHLLTYWTLGCLYLGSRPTWPASRIKFKAWNLCLGIATFTGPILLAVFTMIRCQNRWEFVLIAVWKLCLSATVALSTVTVGLSSKKDSQGNLPPRRSFLGNANWMYLYLLGLLVGLIGLGSLIRDAWDNTTVRIITYAFVGASGAGIVILGIMGCFSHFFSWKHELGALDGVTGILAVMIALGVLYSDWILGAIAGSLVGYPGNERDNDFVILYFVYFALKRLPMLAW